MSQPTPDRLETTRIGEKLPGWSIATLALLVLGLYLLMHPYRGIIQDARLYSLQALNHLHPDLYGNDIFLRYGSQDKYTLFSPLYAWVISRLDVETAASLITGFTAVTFCLAAWWLARSLMPTRFAWLALGLLVSQPGFYGSGGVFAILEGFVTPRQLAECLVLFSLVAWLRERRLLAASLLLVGALVHPIMTFPGVVLLFVLGWGLTHWRSLSISVLVVTLLICCAFLGWIPIARWQVDPTWFEIISRGSYVTLGNWSQQNWADIVRLLGTLGIAALSLDSGSRRLAIGTLITCGALLMLSWVGGDLLHIKLILQGQAWRTLWLVTVIATLLLPAIALACWQGPPMRRCGFLLLAVAWILGDRFLAPFLVAIAVIAVGANNESLSEQLGRAALRVSAVTLAVVLICCLAIAWLDFAAYSGNPDSAAWLAKLRIASANGVLPSFALLGGWYAATRIRSRGGLACLALAISLPVSMIGATAVKPWTTPLYTHHTRKALAGWRTLIPSGTEVVWAADLLPNGDPAGAWLLLERPSYFSSAQAATGLFSRAAALELQRRAMALPVSLPVEYPYKIVPPGPVGLGPKCAEIPARHIVTQVLIPDARMIPAPSGVGPPFDKLKLYICP